MAEDGSAEAGSGAEPSAAAGPSFSMRMVIYGIKKKFPSVRNVSTEQLQRWKDEAREDLYCLDTRASDEFAVSHLPGAIHVDPERDHSLQSLGIPPTSTVVCYCSVGYRSSDVAQKLYRAAKSQGQEMDLKIFNLEGGIFQWVCEERSVVDNDERKANSVHPYSSFWGRLLPSKLRAAL